MFDLNLSVHDLLCQVSKTGHKQNISLVYKCKQELILLYTLCQDVRQTITQADRKYQKLSYVEEALKCITFVLKQEDSVDDEIRQSNNRPSDGSLDTVDLLQEKLSRLQRLLEDLKHNIVIIAHATAASQENPTKSTTKLTKAPTPPGRCSHLLPKLSFLSSLVIISVVSVSCWSFHQSCHLQASLQIWLQFGFSNGPQPV